MYLCLCFSCEHKMNYLSGEFGNADECYRNFLRHDFLAKNERPAPPPPMFARLLN